MGRPGGWNTRGQNDFELPLEILGDRSLLFKHFMQLARQLVNVAVALAPATWPVLVNQRLLDQA